MLDIHGITNLQIHGKNGQSVRMDIVSRFKNTGNDGRALGDVERQTALNPCANILIVLVRVILSILRSLIVDA